MNTVLLAAAVASLAAAPAPPQRAQFWLFLDEVPVGTVELKLEGDVYSYASTHFFGGSPREPARGSFRAKLSAGHTVDERIPVSLFLWQRSPERRCEEVFDEVTGRRGSACINDRLGEVDLGTALGTPYRARYRDGVLYELELGDAQFRRAAGAPPPPPDVFALGIPVKGPEGRLEFTEPQGEKVRPRPLLSTLFSRERIERVIAEARARLEPDETGACVALAEEVLSKLGRTAGEVVYGVVLDGVRVYPHAWLRVQSPDDEEWLFDPGMGIPVKPTTHLEITSGEVGEVYLRLWSGALGVVRIPEATGEQAPPEDDAVTRTE